MARGITEQDVFQAADALLMRGARPTIERVRQELGRGSPNTVNRMLDAWWSTLSQRVTESSQTGLPASLTDACTRLYEQIRQQALSEADHRVNKTQQRLDEERRTLEQAQEALSAERDGVRSTVAALSGELSALRAENQAATAEIAKLHAALATARNHTSEAQLGATLAAQERDRAVESARAETERVRAQWQGNETRWLREIDVLRDERKQSRQEHDKQVREIADRLKEAQGQTSDLRKEVLSQRRTLEVKERQLGREREARIAAQVALGASRKTSKSKPSRIARKTSARTKSRPTQYEK